MESGEHAKCWVHMGTQEVLPNVTAVGQEVQTIRLLIFFLGLYISLNLATLVHWVVSVLCVHP